MHAKVILLAITLFVGVLGSPKPQVAQQATTSVHAAEPTAVTSVIQYYTTTATPWASTSVIVVTRAQTTTLAATPAVTTISVNPVTSNVTNSTAASTYTSTLTQQTVNVTSTRTAPWVQTSPINATASTSGPVNSSSTASSLPINAINQNSAEGAVLSKTLGAGIVVLLASFSILA